MNRVLAAALAVVISGCAGGAASPPAEPTAVDPEPVPAEPVEPDPMSEAPESEAEAETDAEAEAEPDPEPKAEIPEPEFEPGMSVAEARSAVPSGVPRVNLEAERLGQPLQDFSVYEPCNPGRSQHFKIKVAIWQGKAVGIDVKATPKNPKLEACVKEQIAQLEWADRVPSLNTVQYAF